MVLINWGAKMTFEEMQQTISSMLSVQRELQVSQLEFKQEMNEVKDSINVMKDSINSLKDTTESLERTTVNLVEIATKQNKRLDRLYGYSLDAERDRLDILERLIRLERRILEQNS
jgi:uncharacterized phage infection (PIP) family protein YhgE